MRQRKMWRGKENIDFFKAFWAFFLVHLHLLVLWSASRGRLFVRLHSRQVISSFSFVILHVFASLWVVSFNFTFIYSHYASHLSLSLCLCHLLDPHLLAVIVCSLLVVLTPPPACGIFTFLSLSFLISLLCV